LFSMCVGLIDRFMQAAMKAVRNEFEACLMNLAQLELVHADTHAAKPGSVQQSALAAPVVSHGEMALSSGQLNQLLGALYRSEQQNQRSNEMLSAINASLVALAGAMRQSTQSDGRREIAASIKELSQSQRQLALHFSAMRGEMASNQERLTQAIETFGRAQEDTRDAVSDVALRQFAGPGLGISIGIGGGRGAGAAAQQGAAAGSGAAAGENGAGGLETEQRTARRTETPNRRNVPDIESVGLESGARAMMAKLAYALGGKTIGAAKSASEDRVRKLEHSVIATQQLSRQVLRRLDDARKDETRVAVSTAKAQRTLVASLDQLVARLDELMEEGEIIAKSRIDDVSTAIDEVKAQMDVSIDRLEGHIAANRQETAKVQATAQTAAQETVKLARFIDERLVKTAGAR
jgi:hypothetical protein